MNCMSRIVKLLGVVLIGLPFVLLFRQLWSSQKLPIIDVDPCLVQIEVRSKNTNAEDFGTIPEYTSMAWIAYYDPQKKRAITAYHVIDRCNTTITSESNIFMGSSSKNISSKNCFVSGSSLKNIKRVGTWDIATFVISSSACGFSFDIPMSGTYLVTMENGLLKKIPVRLSGTLMNYNPNRGQSGSPVFENGKIIGVTSRKYNDGWVIELIDVMH